MNYVTKAIASAIILGIFAALALIYMTGCAAIEVETKYGSVKSDGKAVKLILPTK